MSEALRQFARNAGATPQSEKADARQVKNSAGGFSFKVKDADRLKRFLILGTEGGTFYANQRNLTRENANFVIDLIRRDEALVRETVVEVSDKALAPKNGPALFTLALLFTEGKDKAAARAALPKVARTSTHLFEFAEYIKSLGGWGRAKRGAIADWYTSKTPESLAYQAVKYRQRNGWTHRDLFRLSHPVGINPALGNFILGKDNEIRENVPVADLTILNGYRFAQDAKGDVKEAVKVVKMFPRLPWEAYSTEVHKSADFWKALFEAGALGQTALVRNVTRFARLGLFDDVKFAGDVAKALADPEAIEKGRMHPVAYLNALHVYRDGPMDSSGYYSHSRKRPDYKVNAKIAGALEKGFYAAFKNVTPANKRTMVSVDVSGSMTWQAPAGVAGLDCLQAAAAMAMVTARTEPYVTVNAFSTGMQDVNVSDSDSLQTVLDKFGRLNFGGTDVSAPIVYAMDNNIAIDTFIVYTDNETWAGRIHPHEALQKYRRKTGIDARLVVVGMASNGFTVADPSDSGMLDVVGFDSSAPAVISDFSAGRF